MGITATLSTNNEYAETGVSFPVFVTIEDLRGNLLINSNDLSGGEWTKRDATTPSITETSPIGTEDATKITFSVEDNSFMFTDVPCAVGDIIVGSFYIWSTSAFNTTISLKSTSGWTGHQTTAIAANSSPQRVTVSRVADDTLTRLLIGGVSGYPATDAGSFYVWGVQVEKGTLGSLYQTTGSAVSPSTAATIKEVKLHTLSNGTSNVSASVKGFFQKLNDNDTSFQIPLSSSVAAICPCTLYETGAGGGNTMFKWVDLKAEVQIDDDTDYSICNVNRINSNTLTRGVISEPSVEHSGMLDFSKFENSGLIYL